MRNFQQIIIRYDLVVVVFNKKNVTTPPVIYDFREVLFLY